MNDLFVGLVLAAVTGVTFLAYKHPKGYAKLYTAFLWLNLAVWIAITSFSMGAKYAHNVLAPMIKPGSNSMKVLEAALPSPTIYTIIMIVVSSYFYFLRVGLPKLISPNEA